MLTTCKECGLQVSDKAVFCPHCGFPMNPKTERISSGRKRLPNGFGQITKIKNKNLRNPYRAMVTVGKTDLGRPITKLLQPQAYFKTYNDAYAALVAYNKDPYSLEGNITFAELYALWCERSEEPKWARIAWTYCCDLHGMKLRDIRSRHLRYAIDNARNENGKPASPTVQSWMKTTFNAMFDYAVENEYVDKNRARMFSIDAIIGKIQEEKEKHIDYTDTEIDTIFRNINRYEALDLVAIQCYSGWRPGELLDLRIENINLEEGLMRGGNKTKAGKNRVVPIHPKIYDLVKARCELATAIGSEWFAVAPDKRTSKHSKLEYGKFWRLLREAFTDLNINTEHRPHDGRTHFVTMAKKFGVDDFAIKYLIGHAISDMTETTYTRRDINWLRDELGKIK